jgi:hypothetical protein
MSSTSRCGNSVGSAAVRFWNSLVDVRNIFAVYALRRAISTVWIEAPSLRNATIS